MRTEFVDREEHLTELHTMATNLAEGRGGGALVVDGVFGMGKSALFAECVRQGSVAGSALTGCRVVLTCCHPTVGPGALYDPVTDLLTQLTEPERQPGLFRRVLSGTRRGAAVSTPDVLSSLVPGLGTLFTVGREVTQAALSTGSLPGDSVLPYQQGAAKQIADALLEKARSGKPVLALVDDIQHIDPSSLMVLDRVLEVLADEPFGLVLGHGTGNGAQETEESMVDALLTRWEMTGLLGRRSLTGLPQSAVAELVRRHHGPPALSTRLSAVTRGHPIFVSLCLREWRPQDGDEVSLPASVAQAVEGRIGRLSESDQELLAVAAVQGECFLTSVVAEATGLRHDTVMERVRRIAHSRRLVHEMAPPDWASGAVTDSYRFENRALQHALYEQQSAQQKRSRHAACAGAMETLLPADGSRAPLDLRLEIARHLRLGGSPTRHASATAHYELARLAATEGLSFAEAERHGEQALRDIRDLPAGMDRDVRLVDVVELLLSLTEVRWRGSHQPAGDPADIDGLAAAAEAAASRTGDPAVVARTTLLRGKTLLATQGLDPALGKLREGVERAEERDDAVALFVARVEYGRQLPKRDLPAGLRQLRLAEELYASDSRLGRVEDPVLQHARNLGEMQLGVNLYDSGCLGEALTRLLRCVERLRGESLRTELPIALNYLAQVHIATGAETEAERALREALRFEEERGGASGWHAYNCALLALVLAHDPERPMEARATAERAWLETEETWLVNLVPIVRNLYAEVLLETARGAASAGAVPVSGGVPGGEALDEAYRLAEDTCVETRRTGMIRSEIAAHTLRARVCLSRGDAGEAATHAREAVRLLDEVGAMPALRTEEVLHHASRALRAVGQHVDAESLARRARREVMRKARRLADADGRDRFLTGVPLNRWILAADEA